MILWSRHLGRASQDGVARIREAQLGASISLARPVSTRQLMARDIHKTWAFHRQRVPFLMGQHS